MKFAFGYGRNLGPGLDMSMLDLDPNTPQRFHVGTSYGYEFESLKTDLSIDPPWGSAPDRPICIPTFFDLLLLLLFIFFTPSLVLLLLL